MALSPEIVRNWPASTLVNPTFASFRPQRERLAQRPGIPLTNLLVSGHVLQMRSGRGLGAA